MAMSLKKILGTVLVVLGVISITLPFTREFILISLVLIAFGTVTIARDVGDKERVGRLLRSMRRDRAPEAKGTSPRIDPLLPVRVLKLAESRRGSLTVSAVAMALNVGLDECQLALDELVRKGAANVDIDLSTGVANYVFPEFLPHTIEGTGIN
jgi:uncharacterized membrane protein YbaN (DUF454 family)